MLVPDYVLTDVLGSGRSCSVYLGHREDVPAEKRVIKIFNCAEDYRSEADALTALSGSGARVPVIHDHNEERLVLIVGPVGIPVRPVPGGRPVSGQQLASLVETLEKAHVLGIVHRDVKPQNIFLTTDSDTDDCIMLNDWGSSCLRDSQQTFVGTYGYCDPRAQGQVLGRCTADADLRGLVRTAFVMYTGLAPPHDRKFAEEFWAGWFIDGTIWWRAMDCADRLDYDELRVLFKQL